MFRTTQDDTVTVPDLTGLNIPQAAAALNKAGLAFGKETSVNRRNEHFWTGANGVRPFNVVQGGLERAICQAAPPNSQDQPTTCEFYLPSGASEEIALHHAAIARGNE